MRNGRPELAARRRRTAAPRVHGRGEARLDAMLALAEEASRAAPLAEVLGSLCERIRVLLAVDVCSVYLRDDGSGSLHLVGDQLVLRATSGYPASAVGVVRMRVGEGLTGFAVECLRPVSVARAARDARNKAFEELDEERYPALCAIPLVDGGRAVGALVIQRRLPRAFGQREVVLAASVAAPILFALERGRSRERDILAAQGQAQARAGRPREVVLTGRVLSPGRALGTLCVRRLGGNRRVEATATDPDAERWRLGEALARASEEMAGLEAWATERASIDRATMTALLSPSRYVLDDARLRGFMLKQVKAGASAEAAVERVVREYTRVLSGAGDPLLTARAHEVEALGLRVLGHLGAPVAPLRPGAVLCASRLTVCDAIELHASHGSGVVLATSADDAPGIAVALALGMPVVGGIAELFRWAADGDRALVDADSGRVTLNPSGVDVAAFRRA